MSRISKADRELQLRHEAEGEHLYANRVRVYPKSVHGPVRRIKWAILIACLTIYYLLPWLRWHRGVNQPDQAVLLSIWHERFYFFNLEFWPQDIYYLTGLLIMGAVGLFLVTSLAGRVWCGYTCPQTVWTDLFMGIERLIEGDRNDRMKRDAAPISLDTIWRKTLKHVAWLGIAFWTGGAWIMYYVDAPTVTVEFWTGTASKEVYFFTFLFTATTYALAGWRASRSARICARGHASRRPCWTSRASPSPIKAGVVNRARAASAMMMPRRPATASIAVPASPRVPPASTSATASSSNASIAASASMRATM
jgi:hypothetical protein